MTRKFYFTPKQGTELTLNQMSTTTFACSYQQGC